MGASGMKETLRRLRAGGIVTLFPEGTRSADGELGPLKPGIAVLVARAGVPVVPGRLAGTFDAWPRSRLFPCPVRCSTVPSGRPSLPNRLPEWSLRRLRRLSTRKSGNASAWQGMGSAGTAAAEARAGLVKTEPNGRKEQESG